MASRPPRRTRLRGALGVMLGAAGACVGAEGVTRGPAPALLVEGLPPPPPRPQLPLVGPPEEGFQVALPSPLPGDVEGLARALGRHEVVEVAAVDAPRLREAALRLLVALPREGTDSIDLRWMPTASPVDGAVVAELSAPGAPRGAVELEWPYETPAASGAMLLIIPPARGEAFETSACETTLAAWGEAQRHALARLQPYLDHVDASLLHFHRRELRRRMGEGAWRTGRPPVAKDASACSRSWANTVASELACASEEELACRFAPRVHLVGDLRVGVPQDPSWRDENCSAELGFDPRAELLDVARVAAEATGEATSSAWAELGQRAALLGELSAILEDACEPAPRVDDSAAQTRIERRLRAIGSAYAAAPSHVEGTRWQLDDGAYVLATGEAMEQVARVFVAQESPADHMAALLASLREDVAAATACGRGEHGAEFLAVLLEGHRVTWVSSHPVSPNCPS